MQNIKHKHVRALLQCAAVILILLVMIWSEYSSFCLFTASSQSLTMRTTYAVYCTGQVSGFIIFSCHLHNARGIKLNLHNFFDYTCYEMWVTLIYKMAWYKVNGWSHLLAPLPFLNYSQRIYLTLFHKHSSLLCGSQLEPDSCARFQ